MIFGVLGSTWEYFFNYFQSTWAHTIPPCTNPPFGNCRPKVYQTVQIRHRAAGHAVEWLSISQFRSTSSLVCRTWVCWSAVCILQIYYRGPPPPDCRIACIACMLFFTLFSRFFRTPSWRPFGPPKTSIVANLDPKMTPTWSPKSKKNQTSQKSEN